MKQNAPSNTQDFGFEGGPVMQEKPIEIKKSHLSAVSEASVSNWFIEKSPLSKS